MPLELLTVVRCPKRRRQRQPLFIQHGTMVVGPLLLFHLPSLLVVVAVLDPDPQQKAVIHDVQFPQQRAVQCQLLLQDLRVESILQYAIEYAAEKEETRQ